MDPQVVSSGDDGTPIVVRNPDSAVSRAYFEISERLAAALSVISFESDTSLRPREIAEEEGTFRIVWSDGHESRYPFDYLRNNCPCARCVDEWTGERKASSVAVPSDFRPLSVNPVGSYAIQIPWSDGHSTGIYSFRRLRGLCSCEACKPA